MADFRQIHTTIWTDEYFLDLDPVEKLLFIYLFSNRQSSISGLYKLPMKVIEFETGLPVPIVLEILDEFSKANKIHYQDGIVWVVNMARYHQTKSPKVLARVQSDVDKIPDCTLKVRYQYAMDTFPQLKEEEEEEEKEEEEGATTTAPQGEIITDKQAERLYQQVTGQVTFPSTSRADDIRRICAMAKAYGQQATQERMATAYKGWLAAPRKGGGKGYSRLNTGWLDWAVIGPGAESKGVEVRVDEDPDMAYIRMNVKRASQADLDLSIKRLNLKGVPIPNEYLTEYNRRFTGTHERQAAGAHAGKATHLAGA